MNNEIKFIISVIFCLMQTVSSAQTGKVQNHGFKGACTNSAIPENVCKLMAAYPDESTSFFDNKIYFTDSTYLVYDDSIQNKDADELLNEPDIEDQCKYSYIKGGNFTSIPQNRDPGRIRNEMFFKKLYGSTKEEVRKTLVEIVWCPKLIYQKKLVTKINGVAEKVKQISSELDNMPELKEYLKNIGGIFNWRNINGTNRLSMHSFGMTIDINTAYSNYWQWDCKCTNEKIPLNYHNKIPWVIIQIFEKYGFIWGGAWYHYDTMHFEYRPELLLDYTAANKSIAASGADTLQHQQ